MKIQDIDFGQIYRDHMRAAGGREKPPQAWDARAEEMGKVQGESPYVRSFVERMDLGDAQTLLDVGCGTGAIALALAPRLRQVYALDYSQGMLDVLMRKAHAAGIRNITPIRLSWEDDWSSVPECDLVTASRSTTVMDMADALGKLDAKARLGAYLTNMVGGRFVDDEIARLIGCQRPALPDAIYIVNILWQMGRLPRLDYIESESRFAGALGFDAFVEKVRFSLGPLDEPKIAALRAWFDANPDQARRGGSPFRWAFVGWSK